MFFYTTLFIHPGFLHQDKEITEGIGKKERSKGGTEGINEGINEDENQTLSEKELLVLNALKANPSVSVAKLVNELGFSRASIERMLKTMKSRKIITREGSRKKGRWVILPEK